MPVCTLVYVIHTYVRTYTPISFIHIYDKYIQPYTYTYTYKHIYALMYTYIYVYICNALHASCNIQVVHFTTMCGEVMTWVSPGSSLQFKQVGQRGVTCPRCTLEEVLCSWEDTVRIYVDIY